MGNSISKKCDDIKVVMESPKKFELKFLESNVSHAGYQIFRFDVPKKKKISNGNIIINFIFKKTFINKHFSIYKPDLNKNVLGTDKVYYNTNKVPLEKGTVHLRLDNNFILENVIVELCYQDLRFLNYDKN